MRKHKVLSLFMFLIISTFLIKCGTTSSSIRNELGIPNPDPQKLIEVNRDLQKHPHDVGKIIEFGELLYATGQYYEAYNKWLYAKALDPNNKKVQELINRGIIAVLFEPAEFKTESEYKTKWYDQTFKVEKRKELEEKLVRQLAEETHLPEDVIKSRMITLKWDCKKMKIDDPGKNYEGYVYILSIKIPFFSAREILRVFKVEDNIKKGNYIEAAKAIDNIIKYFPHAKDKAQKMKVKLKKAWYKKYQNLSSITFADYEKQKDEIYAFIKMFPNSKEAKKLKIYIEQLLYTYFTSTPIRSLDDAIKYYNNVQKFRAEFKGSKYSDLVEKELEKKWTTYIRNSASVIVADPKRTKRELLAFRNAFGGRNPELVKQIETLLDNTMMMRYLNLEIVDTTDVNKAFEIISMYKQVFPNSQGYFKLLNAYQQRIYGFITGLQIEDGETMKIALALYEKYKKYFPNSPYIESLTQFIEGKRQALEEEASRYVQMAEDAKSKNQYTLAVRYIEKALELNPDDEHAKRLKESMQEYMDAVAELNTAITKANDAPTYQEAMEILDAYINKYASKYPSLVKEAKTEKRRLSRWKRRWDKRRKNVFSNMEE